MILYYIILYRLDRKWSCISDNTDICYPLKTKLQADGGSFACAAVYSGIGRWTDRGEPGAARAFCGIDYSLLSRCTSRVKSTPLSTTITSSSSSSSTPSAGSSSSLFLISLSPLPLYLTLSRPIFLSLSLQRPDLSFATNFYLISTPSLQSLSVSLPLSSSLASVLYYRTLSHLHAYRMKREREKYVHRHSTL